jgi:integrase/recombinase XerD
VRQFVRTLDAAAGIHSIDQDSINKWLIRFDSRKGTLNLKKNALRSFLNYLKAEHKFMKEIRITTKQLPRPEPQFLTITEQEKLLRYARSKGIYSKYHVIIRLMLYSGMRISEVLGLRFADVDGDRVILRETKHGSVRRKLLKKEIAVMLDTFLHARRTKSPFDTFPHDNDDYVFMSQYMGRYKSLSPEILNKVLKRFAREAGITKRISCHTLRHSFSVRFLSRGGSLRGLQQYLGHRDIKTTAVYLHCTDDDLKKELERL